MIASIHKTCAAAVLLALAVPAAHASPKGNYIERGRYLVKVGGCNDCHTAGYGMSAGKIAEKDWLQGD